MEEFLRFCGFYVGDIVGVVAINVKLDVILPALGKNFLSLPTWIFVAPDA